MPVVAIPSWDSRGLLPPIDPNSPVGADRSPYEVSLSDLVMRFASSPPRREILLGFLDFRAALHNSGIISGFQWVDGSFMENIEAIENRPPGDIDVVSFLNIPQNFAITPQYAAAFDHDATKLAFHVDSYIEELNLQPADMLVSASAYWYSVWSHRRNMFWKGFLQVDMAPIEDAVARTWLLQQSAHTGGQP